MRRRSEPHTFEQRIDAQRLRLEQEMANLPSGKQRDAISVRIDQLQAAAEMHDFLRQREEASGLR
jgi:hypothetical protein